MILIIQSLLSGDYTSLKGKLLIVGIMWLLVAVAIIIDLISGVRKAKEAGELRTSIGFRRTVDKVIQYYAFLLFAFLFDCIIMLVISSMGFGETKILPFVTLVASCFLVFIEWKSFMEKSNEKDRKKFKRGVEDMMVLIDNRDDLINGLSELVKTKLEKEKEDQQNGE